MNGPRKNLTPLDMMMMNRASMQGGVMNFLGKQPEVTAPVRAQSHADSPPVELAYITDAEKDLLVKANIHGSMAGKPNPGPAGIASLDDFFSTPGGGIGGGSTADAREPDRPDSPVLGGGGGGTSAEDYGIQPGMAVGGGDQGTGGQVFVSPQSAGAGQDQVNKFVDVSDPQQKRLEALAEARRAQTLSNLGLAIPDRFGIFKDADTGVSGIDTTLKNIYDRITGGANFTFPSFFGIGVKALDALRGPTVESFRNPDFLATIEKKFKDDPNFSREDFYREYRDEIDQVFDVGLGDLTSEEMFRAQSEKAFNQAATGELGSDLQQRVNPVGYYTDDEGKVRNVPATAAQAKEMVDAFRFANLDEDPAFKNLSNAEKRRLTAAIMEAQAIDYDRQTRQDANMRQTTDPNEGSFSRPFTPGPGPTPPPGGDQPPGTPPQQPGQPFFPFPSTGIASIFNPEFMGPSFDPRMAEYTRRGLGDRSFDQFYRNLGLFPRVV